MMKNILYILILFLLIGGCKSKSLNVQKTVEKQQIDYSKKFDSLSTLYAKLQEESLRKNSFFSRNFILKSVPVFDSLGNRKPLNYKHYINGELAEEIYLEAGDLTEETQNKKAEESKTKNQVKSESKRIESDVGIKVNNTKAKNTKTKDVEVKGFQFGFYAWLFLIVVVLIILRQLTKKGG